LGQKTTVNWVFSIILAIRDFIGIVLGDYLSIQQMLSTLLVSYLEVIDKKMFNYKVTKKNIYGKATESFLFIQVKAWKQQHGEKING
jgi:hypothetical protein